MSKDKEKNQLSLSDPQFFHLRTQQLITPVSLKNIATAFVVGKNNFAALDGITCYTLEVWEECMRLPHWHPNASELGYVISGQIEVITWRSPGESAVFTLGPGMCWFIPKGALHSLNNIGKEHAKLLVGFGHEQPDDMDLPVAFNGVPVPVRDAYTSPHVELRKWSGVTSNPLFGRFPFDPTINKVLTASPYGFDLAKVTPLFNDPALGSVIWGVKSNWNILEDMSMLRAILKPGVARDLIWYPDVGTLYVVAQGSGQFNIIVANTEARAFDIALYDYIYVPMGIPHTFINTSINTPAQQDLEMIAFFTNANPQPEVSLSVSTAFFPENIRNAALNNDGLENKTGAPLKHLNFTEASPYLVRVRK